MKLYPRKDWVENYPEDKMQVNCPFCNHDNPYNIFETDYWRVVHNKFPILGLTQHIMAVPKSHVIHAKDLSTQEFADYKNVEVFVSEFYDESSYFTFMRESVDGRSIEHLHYHFLPGKIYYEALETMLGEQGFTNQLDSPE